MIKFTLLSLPVEFLSELTDQICFCYLIPVTISLIFLDQLSGNNVRTTPTTAHINSNEKSADQNGRILNNERNDLIQLVSFNLFYA